MFVEIVDPSSWIMNWSQGPIPMPECRHWVSFKFNRKLQIPAVFLQGARLIAKQTPMQGHCERAAASGKYPVEGGGVYAGYKRRPMVKKGATCGPSDSL